MYDIIDLFFIVRVSDGYCRYAMIYMWDMKKRLSALNWIGLNHVCNNFKEENMTLDIPVYNLQSNLIKRIYLYLRKSDKKINCYQ